MFKYAVQRGDLAAIPFDGLNSLPVGNPKGLNVRKLDYRKVRDELQGLDVSPDEDPEPAESIAVAIDGCNDLITKPVGTTVTLGQGVTADRLAWLNDGPPFCQARQRP